MKIKEISVGYSRKIMVRPYEPIESNMSVTVSLEEWDDVDEVVKKMQKYCDKKVEEALPLQIPFD